MESQQRSAVKPSRDAKEGGQNEVGVAQPTTAGAQPVQLGLSHMSPRHHNAQSLHKYILIICPSPCLHNGFSGVIGSRCGVKPALTRSSFLVLFSFHLNDGYALASVVLLCFFLIDKSVIPQGLSTPLAHPSSFCFMALDSREKADPEVQEPNHLSFRFM